MTIKRNIVVCLVLVTGTYVYGMMSHNYWMVQADNDFVQWTAKRFEESNKHFLEMLKTELSKKEREMICSQIYFNSLYIMRVEERYKPVERQEAQKKAEKK